MSVEAHKRYAPTALGFAVLTVSSSRTPETDDGGALLAELVGGAGHRVEARRWVGDDVEAIRAAVEALLASPEVDVVVTTGGTGLSPRDLTPEAVEPLLQRRVDGFGELFRHLSYQQIGAAALLSRALAGVAGSKAVFLLPGSPKAVRLGMEALVLPEVGHLLGQLRRAERRAR